MSANLDTSSRLLVIGASGQLGKLVLTNLLDKLNVDSSRIIAGSRSPEKLEPFAARGVTTRSVDFYDPATIVAAAQGVDRALIISGDRLGERLEGHKSAVTALVKAGVKHILYTSLVNADHATAVIGPDHKATEAFIRESGIQGYTILRNSIYLDESTIGVAGIYRAGGKWESAAKDGKLGYISRDDLAFAAAIALASNDYESHTYELQGKGITIDEFVANVAKATGKEITVVQVSEEELTKNVVAHLGVPEFVAQIFSTLDSQTANGLSYVESEDFKKLTGRDPVTHEEWIEVHKDLLLSQ